MALPPVTPPAVSAAAADPGRYAFDSPRYAMWVVLVLCGLQIAGNMDMVIVSLVVEHLRADFGVTDIQVSLLQGLAFALFYSIVAVPIGWAADRWRRNRIILIGATCWTLATLACMVADSYGQLFLARMLVGMGEAALVPAAFSLLSDYFPRDRLAGAVSTVTGASFMGAGGALAFGGIFLSYLPQTGTITLPVFGDIYSWQLAFGLVTIPGLLLIPIFATVREPPRRVAGEQRDEAGLGELLSYLRAHWKFWLPLIAGLNLMNMYQFGMTAWTVTFFMRTYGWTAGDAGLLYGLYFMVLGTAAGVIGGRWCDRLIARGWRDANFFIPLVSAVCALPLTVAFALCGSATVSAVLIGVITFVSTVSLGPGIAAIPLYVPNRMRAQAVALHLLLAFLIGGGGGPWLIAFFTDKVFGDPAALRYSISLASTVLLIPCAACLLIGMRSVRRLRLVS